MLAQPPSLLSQTPESDQRESLVKERGSRHRGVALNSHRGGERAALYPARQMRKLKEKNASKRLGGACKGDTLNLRPTGISYSPERVPALPCAANRIESFRTHPFKLAFFSPGNSEVSRLAGAAHRRRARRRGHRYEIKRLLPFSAGRSHAFPLAWQTPCMEGQDITQDSCPQDKEPQQRGLRGMHHRGAATGGRS